MLRALLTIAVIAVWVGSVVAEDRPIAASATEAVPLQAGVAVPAVTLQDAEGQSVKLSDFYADGPLVIVFFRGSWCPICTRHFQAVMKAQPEIAKLGAKLVAISPDSVENTKGNTTKLNPPFPLLSDADLAATRAFGLAFTVDDITLAKYKQFGIDLEKASGHKHHALPVPAVYIVDRAGKIVFAHSNPDYSQRLDVETILAELKKLQ